MSPARPTPERPHGLLLEIDHVAIAVADMEAAVAWYEEVLGAAVAHREVVESDGVEEVLLAVAESFVQLVAPTGPDSTVARFLERHGEGLHHVGYRVASCEAALAAAVAAGAVPIDQVPRPGSRGTTVAFLHPKSALGTLIELVEVGAEEASHASGATPPEGAPESRA